jgi:two-component system sensor histidine kinase DctS
MRSLIGAFTRWRSAHTRWSLWGLLIVLVAGMLATLMWLAGRYETSQVQSRLERDTGDAVNDIRAALTRNVQSLQALHAGNPTPGSWTQDAQVLLREHREHENRRGCRHTLPRSGVRASRARGFAL